MWQALLFSTALMLSPAESQEAEEAAAPPPPSVERFLLMKSLQGTWYGGLLDENKVRVYGWTDMSYTASSVQASQLPMGFNYRANEFLLQQNWLRVERPTDRTAKEPTFGFRSDTILPGSDYRFTIARGLFDNQLTANDGQPATYGIDPVQFYLEGYFPEVGRGLMIKAGRFFAQFGQESIDATLNALPSRSYSFIYDPFTHTGLLTQLQLDETWSVQNGLVLGSDVFIDPAAVPTYLGAVKWAPPGGRASALFSVVVSDPHFDRRQNFNRPQVFDLVLTYKINDRLDYVLDALYAYQLDVPGIGLANWFSLGNYLTWRLGPQLTGAARLEFFDDVQGQRTGFAGLYTALTCGLTYRPGPAVALRPEVRYDYNEQTRPFEGKKGVLTAAVDVLVRW